MCLATISVFPSVKGGSCAGTSGTADVEGGLSLVNAFPLEFGFPDPLTFKEVLDRGEYRWSSAGTLVDRARAPPPPEFTRFEGGFEVEGCFWSQLSSPTCLLRLFPVDEPAADKEDGSEISLEAASSMFPSHASRASSRDSWSRLWWDSGSKLESITSKVSVSFSIAAGLWRWDGGCNVHVPETERVP